MLPLTVKVLEYSSVHQNPELLAQLRSLTLNPGSGMNCELDRFAWIQCERDVNVKIILAYHNDELVGWSFVSKEKSDFFFFNSDGFNPLDGLLFQVYVSPSFRRNGIGKQLLQAANRLANGDRLCICPWDDTSEIFYDRCDTFASKRL